MLDDKPSAYQKYEERQQQREALASLMEEQAHVLRMLDMTSRVETLDKVKEHLLKDDFKVLVLGEFKTGKSTFINALLGAEVLPAYATPTTAIINEIKWGEERRALLHLKASEDSSTPPIREVTVEELEDYVVIQNTFDKEQEIRESPYEKVELFWPLELCNNGVEIIDSPGLNEHEVREKVTLDYLEIADAVLFVMSSERLGPSRSEAVSIKSLRATGHEKIFFLCNRFHTLPPRERERVRQYGLGKLSPLTDLREEGVFFIDSLDALHGRLAHDPALMDQSGMPPVEARLARFLTDERGRMKILRPAYELKISIREVRDAIPRQESMLKDDLKAVEDRYLKAQEPLRQLQVQREQIIARVNLAHAETRTRIAEKAQKFYLGLANKVEGWIEEYNVQEPLEAGELRKEQEREAAIKRVSAEIAEHVQSKIEPETIEWQQAELQPLLEETARELKSELDPKMGEFLRNLDDVRLEVTHGISASQLPKQAIGGDVTPTNRILSAVGGGIIGGVGTAWIGATFGFREMAKYLIPNVGIGGGMLILGLTNPFILIPTMLGVAFLQRRKIAGRMTQGLKDHIGQGYAKQLHEKAAENSTAVAEEIGTIDLSVES